MSVDKTPVATPQTETPAAVQPKPVPKPIPPKPIDQAEHGRRRRPHGGEQE